MEESSGLTQIKLAVRDRISQIANNVSNYRVERVEYELESVMAVLTQLPNMLICLKFWTKKNVRMI